MEYTPDQVKDIQEREQKALDALKELELTPAATIQAVNLGNDVFATKVIPFLQDVKYAPKSEPAKDDQPAS